MATSNAARASNLKYGFRRFSPPTVAADGWRLNCRFCRDTMGARSQQYGYDSYDGYDGYGYGNAYASRRASPPALVPEWVWKLGSMLVAAAVVCFGFFLVKNVNELFKTNRRSKARVALPTKPAVEDAKSRQRRELMRVDEERTMLEEEEEEEAAGASARSTTQLRLLGWYLLLSALIATANGTSSAALN